MRATANVKKRRRNLATIKRRRKRRRLLKVWCARLMFLIVIIIIVLFVTLIIDVFTSNGKERETTSHKNEMIKAELIEIHLIQQTNLKEDDEFLEDSVETIPVIMTEAEVTATEEPLPEPQISAYEAGDVYFYQFTDDEKLYIAKVVYAEARGESFEGQVAVAAVVINRYFSTDPFFEKETIQAVILQKNQFASIVDVTEEKLNNYPSCMEAVEAACKGYDPTRKQFEEGAKYFFDPKGITSEYQLRIRTGIEELVIGNHHFHNEFNEEEVSKGR